jgi:hypothetical protein
VPECFFAPAGFLGGKMPDMIEEEYDALDELLTKTTPKVSGDGKSGFFMQHKDEIVILDHVSATYLREKIAAPV